MRLRYAENNRESATFFATQSFLKAPQNIDKQRKTSNHNGLLVFTILVEMGGVEPLRYCYKTIENTRFYETG